MQVSDDIDLLMKMMDDMRDGGDLYKPTHYCPIKRC